MNPTERQQINKLLGGKGLATLDNPAGFLQHFGYLVRDHEHLRSLLVRCEPEQRRNMYEAIRPHLRFTPQALDIYLSQAGQQAEAEQLPTVDQDGKFHAYRPVEIGQAPVTQETVDTVTAQEVVNQAFAKKWLNLVCAKCTAEATYTGDSKTDCWLRARTDGWLYVPGGGDGGRDHCPKCAQPARAKAA